MGTECKVDRLPKCDFCHRPGEYDFMTLRGPWAMGCEAHWKQHRKYQELGTGKGQKWVVTEKVTTDG